MSKVLEHVRDLRGHDAAEGKWGKPIGSEELSTGGFVAVARGAAEQFRKKENLVGVEGVRGMAVQFPVIEGGEFGDTDFVAGFFANLASRSEGGGLAHIGPAAGECPETVIEFADEKDAPVAEGSNAHINFGRGIAGLLREKVLNGSGAGKSSAGSHHLRGNATDFVVALNIELVLAVGEAGLRISLETARPGEPFWNGHDRILAASGAADKPGPGRMVP